MAHLRPRQILEELRRQAKFWPVTALLGLRQSGKSTILREILGVGRYRTLDDEDTLEDAVLSSKNFLTKTGTPVIIDEAQKAPKLFDAIKLKVDKDRRPGLYYLTGSSQFSARIGIRESLTGRIGISYLYPFTLSEAFGEPLDESRMHPLHRQKPRFLVEEAVKQLPKGGLPVPLFMRDTEARHRYFQSWLETALLRDCARAFGKNYNSDMTQSILRQMGQTLRNGELPTLAHFKQPSRILRRYLDALTDIFILRKLSCHEAGVGKEAWLVTDTGIAQELMGTDMGEGAMLSLSRIFLFNEILAASEALGKRIQPIYYKSARGSPVDLIWNNTLIKVSVLSKSQLRYDERPLHGALKTLKLKHSLLVVPRDETVLTKDAIGTVPLTHWS